MSIYLYIKQHTITGKLYFGKTIKNPEMYFGSGKHWKNHINKHGKEHVVTHWYCLFLDQESCTKFALNFSEQQNIVESDEWLNLKPENGSDGGLLGEDNFMFGKHHSEKVKTESSIRRAETNKARRWFNNGKYNISSKTKPVGEEWVSGMLPKKTKDKSPRA